MYIIVELTDGHSILFFIAAITVTIHLLFSCMMATYCLVSGIGELIKKWRNS